MDPPHHSSRKDVPLAPGDPNVSKSLPRGALKSRLYLKQNQSFSKPKKAKLFDPSDASSSQFVGIRTAADSASVPTPGGYGIIGAGTTASTFYGGTPPPQTPPAGVAGARKLQTSHGEQFCRPQYGTAASSPLPPGTPILESMELDGAASSSRTPRPPRYQLPTSRPMSVSPRRQRPTTAASLKSVLSAHENWKRKRGKFALAAKHLLPNYSWMPFLEFTPLEQWERGYRSFKCIINLNVFRQYKYWKSWKVWKHYVRRKKKKIAIEKLLKRQFWCNIIFAAVLLNIREMCANLWTMKFLKLEHAVIYTLDKFMTTQELVKDENNSRIIQLTHDVGDALRESCTKALIKLEDDLMGRRKDDPNNPNQSKSGHGKDVVKYGQMTGLAAKWKLEKEKELEEKESQERYKYLIAAAKRSEQSRLQNCVRLTDYLIADALREVLTSTLKAFLHRVAHKPAQPPPPPPPEPTEAAPDASKGQAAPPGNQNETEDKNNKTAEKEKRMSRRITNTAEPVIVKRPSQIFMKPEELPDLPQVFEVELAVMDDTLVITPSLQEFERNVEVWIKAMMDVIRCLHRLLYNPILDGVVDKADTGIDNLASFLELIGEGQFGPLISSIKQSITLAYMVIHNPIIPLVLERSLNKFSK